MSNTQIRNPNQPKEQAKHQQMQGLLLIKQRVAKFQILGWIETLTEHKIKVLVNQRIKLLKINTNVRNCDMKEKTCEDRCSQTVSAEVGVEQRGLENRPLGNRRETKREDRE